MSRQEFLRPNLIDEPRRRQLIQQVCRSPLDTDDEMLYPQEVRRARLADEADDITAVGQRQLGKIESR